MEKAYDRLLRIWEIIGDPKANPPIKPLISISRSAWWAGVKSGKFPQSIKLGPKTTVWRESEVLAFIEQCKTKGSDALPVVLPEPEKAAS